MGVYVVYVNVQKKQGSSYAAGSPTIAYDTVTEPRSRLSSAPCPSMGHGAHEPTPSTTMACAVAHAQHLTEVGGQPMIELLKPAPAFASVVRGLRGTATGQVRSSIGRTRDETGSNGAERA